MGKKKKQKQLLEVLPQSMLAGMELNPPICAHLYKGEQSLTFPMGPAPQRDPRDNKQRAGLAIWGAHIWRWAGYAWEAGMGKLLPSKTKSWLTESKSKSGGQHLLDMSSWIIVGCLKGIGTLHVRRLKEGEFLCSDRENCLHS